MKINKKNQQQTVKTAINQGKACIRADDTKSFFIY